MRVNDTQIGGEHYKTGYEHWDLVNKIPLGYLEGCSTKYVTRWRKKGHMEDLQKALHYLDKLIEVATYDLYRNCTHIGDEVHRFTEANCLTDLEYRYIFLLCTYQSRYDLSNARHILQRIMEQGMTEIMKREEINYPGTPEDGGHHAIK